MTGIFASAFFFFVIMHKCVFHILVELRTKGSESQHVPLTKRYFRGILNTILPLPFALGVAVTTRTSVFGITLFDSKSVLSGLASISTVLEMTNTRDVTGIRRSG